MLYLLRCIWEAKAWSLYAICVFNVESGFIPQNFENNFNFIMISNYKLLYLIMNLLIQNIDLVRKYFYSMTQNCLFINISNLISMYIYKYVNIEWQNLLFKTKHSENHCTRIILDLKRNYTMHKNRIHGLLTVTNKIQSHFMFYVISLNILFLGCDSSWIPWERLFSRYTFCSDWLIIHIFFPSNQPKGLQVTLSGLHINMNDCMNT